MNITKYNIIRRINNGFLHRTPYELKINVPETTMDVASIGIDIAKSRLKKFKLVQIGACDGCTGDPIYERLISGDIEAVVVEPVLENYLELKKTYEGIKNINTVNAAIGKNNGKSKFYKVKDVGKSRDPAGDKQLASFDIDHILKHGIPKCNIEHILIDVVTLETLVETQNLNNIDFLLVDTEGYDYDIVNMSLNLDNPPAFICFEFIHLTKEQLSSLFVRLRSMGYRWVHDSLNTLAINSL